MNAITEETQLQSMLNGVDIPPCHAVLIELDAELKRDMPDLREVARLISQDVALSGDQDAAMDRFWESSALTACVSAELARRLRCVRPDVAYTFGLFHDCGIPLLVKRFPQTKEVLAAANAAEERGFTDIEDGLMGTNHAVVGYFLAKRDRKSTRLNSSH